ncbi:MULTISPECIES: PLD nuclease N-terminal domain-containing protein [unclassified Saccharopolyspora]|uniref:PLD nuclease N-terminal domain-containing protein n=1 Tax=Saccharopolyspora TaxID=1835 RepID=UPI001F392F0A|nr:PLD nuclease N-terminal domain-containing protein [Saccharopolyspora sp. HNM0986]
MGTTMTDQASLLAQQNNLAEGAGVGDYIAGGAVGLGITGILIALAVLFIAALVSVLRSPLTGGMKLVWIVIAFVAPFLGSLAWFVFGRRDAYDRKSLAAS